MFNQFIINYSKCLHDALLQINNLAKEKMPLVLFVCNDKNELIGTLTDGDSRRALINGASASDGIISVMNKNFNFIYKEEITNVELVKQFRNKKLKLIPIIDSERRIVDVLDFTTHKSRLPMDAVLMAGGKGERLRPLTLHTPKPLLKIGGKPIIDYNVDNLIDFGVKNIYVTVNYLKEQIIDHYNKKEAKEAAISCIEEEKFLGTIGSLSLIKEFQNDTILIMNSDLLTNINFEDFYSHFKKHKAMMAAAAIPYAVSVPYGIFDLEGREIKGVKEKPTFDYYANAGIYLISKEALKYIPKGKEFNATDLIETLIEDKQKVIRFPLTGMWIDIGTPQEYQRANDFVKYLN